MAEQADLASIMYVVMARMFEACMEHDMTGSNCIYVRDLHTQQVPCVKLAQYGGWFWYVN